MKLAILDKTGKKTGDFELDVKGDIRDDIFKRAFFAESSLFRQEQGADPLAGKRQVINLSKRRRNFRTTYGRGQSRTPKKVMWARGTQHRFVGAFAPNTVGGRKAHAPKAGKNILKDINNKEWALALRTGVISSYTRTIVEASGQAVPKDYPFVLDSNVEDINKTSDFKALLTKIGFGDELERTSERKVRAGKGTMRSRTYKTKRGPLFVLSSMEKPLLKAARNIRGFEVITADLLLASDFGMSEKPGRVVVFTKPALEEFKEALN